MHLTFRAKLMLIAATTTLAFIVMIVGSWLMSQQRMHDMANVEGHLVPKLDLGPRLELGLDRLSRGIQDAVAAQDAAALDATVSAKDELLATIASGSAVIDATDAEAARRAVDDYYVAALDLSRRLIGGETGEGLVDAMAAMQTKLERAGALLKRAGGLNRDDISEGFASVRRSTERAAQFRMIIGIACFVVVLGLSIWVSRSMIRTLSHLSDGFTRFATGDFREPIRVTSRDELSKVAGEANQMAESLRRMGQDRDRSDWLKAGLAGLSNELQGDFTLDDTAKRAIVFLAERVEAVAGVVYVSDADDRLRPCGQYGRGGDATGANPATFRPGEGLLGQAALADDLLVVEDPPADYLRIRSGLGEAAPRALVFIPLKHLGKTIGVVEMAFFQPCEEDVRVFLSSVREVLAVTLDGAKARAALRELLAQTRAQAERLAVQEEELRQSNQELLSQQEELRQTNEELEAQRQELATQNARVEEAHERVKHNAEELAKVSAYKSQFLANMSHELRTPLNSILLLSQLLGENSSKNLTEAQIEDAKTIYGSGKDLLDLINQVLDLAKIEAGRQDVNVEPVRLADLAEHARRMFAPLAQDRGLRLSIEVAQGLPEMIDTDRQRIERILVNLLGNAIKFTKQGEVALRIGRPSSDARLERPDLDLKTAIAFAVSDTGIGIPQKAQELVFAPFEQVDGQTDRRFGGTGLGLSIARESATLIGGELRLESTPGKGSTFTCYLPETYRSESRRPDSVSLRVKAHENGSSHATSLAARLPVDDLDAVKPGDDHLLIIEDDRVFAEKLAELARARRLKAIVADTGAKGLELAKSLKPRGIVLDVKLPDIDGWTVMNRLRLDATTRAIPVHFVSAMDATERGLSLGAVGYLVKPATREELLGVVAALAPATGGRASHVLVVEDDLAAGGSILSLLHREGIEAQHVSSAAAALDALKRDRFGCVLLDLGLPDMDGLTLLETLKKRGTDTPPVVVHTGRALTKEEARRIDEYAEAVVLKDGSSESRLVDEIRLFLRHVKDGLRRDQTALVDAPEADVSLEGTKLLLADDDMRTVYALSALLRSKGAEVLVADTGREALSVLAKHSDVELVLMDIMMPEMDGYEAMRQIRRQERYKTLPIIALTAKAMKGERERCLEAGASDYLSKPVDANRVLAALRQWLKPNEFHDAP